MTDNEIIKALGCCGSENCRGCPYRNGKCHQGNPMIRDARDLIKRQQAEIERLRGEVKEKTEAVDFLKEESVGLLNMFCEAKKEMKKLHPYKLYYGNMRMEIAREFADRLKKRSMTKFDWNEYVEIEEIDNLVKEMEKECDSV